MEARMDYSKFATNIYKAMLHLENQVSRSGIEPMLLYLIKLRASQINGCAFCIDMHSKDLRAGGESEQRLYLLNAWREAPFYTERERAALTLTEAVTLVTNGHVPDDVFAAVKPHFTDEELVAITWAIAAINTWNRIAITFRAVAGTYQPAAH